MHGIKNQSETMSLMSFLMDVLKPYRRYMVALLFTGLIWGILTSATPYTLKLLIDRLAGTSEIAMSPTQLFMIYLFLWIWTAWNHRLVDWIWLNILPDIRRDVINKMYQYVSGHSYHFFQNHLV